MMALLHETVPAFENTWIECLGDLSRYRTGWQQRMRRFGLTPCLPLTMLQYWVSR